jgi:hypothetical protein
MTVAEMARDAGLKEPRRYVVDWARVEAAVGTRLPADYKEYVYWFGPGGFEDSFFVSLPGVENSNTDFLSNLQDEEADLRSWNSGDREVAAIRLFPETGGGCPSRSLWRVAPSSG